MLRVALVVAAAVGLLGCEPPPEVAGGEPSVRIIHPPADVDTIPLDPDGRLAVLMVVDVSGLEFVPPSVSNLVPVDGEGHWHFTVNGVYKGAPEAEFFAYESEPNEFAPGTAMSLRASLATNDHLDLSQFARWEAIVEFTVGDDPTR